MSTTIQLVLHGEDPAFLRWLNGVVEPASSSSAGALGFRGVLLRPSARVTLSQAPATSEGRVVVLDHAAACACCMGGPVLVQALVRALRHKPTWIWLATSGHGGERVESAVFREPGLAHHLRPLRPVIWRAPTAEDDERLEARWPTACWLLASPQTDETDANAADLAPQGGTADLSGANVAVAPRRAATRRASEITDLLALEAFCRPS